MKQYDCFIKTMLKYFPNFAFCSRLRDFIALLTIKIEYLFSLFHFLFLFLYLFSSFIFIKRLNLKFSTAQFNAKPVKE